MQEARGFKGDIGRDKQLNKQRKKEARTAKEKREDKLRDLVSSPKKWKNLESHDIRTPTTYFQQHGEALNKLRGKLDDLLELLDTYKQKRDTTPATKAIVETETDRANLMRDHKVSMENAMKVVDAFIYGTAEDASEAIREALDWKAFVRSEPHLIKTGLEMEDQIFWCNQYGNK